MLIFNQKLLFVNEPQFNSVEPLERTEYIEVCESSILDIHSLGMLKTKWFPMSGQTARYLTTVPFHEAPKGFSWALEIQDVLTLFWDGVERKIRYIKSEHYTPERLRFWVLHTFLPLVLELERQYRILHVGSVEVAGKPILFSALSFGGKSTLADYFLQKGHKLLSDDSLGIEKRDDSYYAVPSYPFHRPFRKLETLGYYTENFETEIKPVHAVYVLEKSARDEEVEIIELKGIEKFKAFHYSSFIDFDFMKKERFEYFTEMAKHVPVYRIQIPWDLKRLHEVYEAIVVYSQKI